MMILVGGTHIKVSNTYTKTEPFNK